MNKKKRSLEETVTSIVINGDEAESEEDTVSRDLRSRLGEMRKLGSITGYILKDGESATVDLGDSAKTAENAMLASQAFETYEEIREPLNLGAVESIVVECKDLKMLCMVVGESTLSVFMEKQVDHAKIQNKLSFQTE